VSILSLTEPAPRRATVHVVAPDCAAAPLAFESFVDSLRVELAASGPTCCAIDGPNSPAPPGGDLTLTIEPCDPSTEQVAVAVADPSSGRSMRRQLSFADVLPTSRPRAMALAVAELVRSLGQSAGPVVPPTPDGAIPPAAASPPVPAKVRFGVGAGAELRLYPRHGTRLWGGRVTFSSAVDRWRWRWQAGLDLHAATGGESFAPGDVGIRTVGADLSAGPHFAVGPADLALGLCGGLGWAWIDGRSTQPAVSTVDGSGLVVSAGGRAAFEAPTSRSVRVLAIVAAGAIARPVIATVAGATAAGIAGAYLLFGLGVSFAP